MNISHLDFEKRVLILDTAGDRALRKNKLHIQLL